MKLASFLFSGPGGLAQSDPDTAIVDDDGGTQMDSLAPNTIADVTLMAPAGARDSVYAQAAVAGAVAGAAARQSRRRGGRGSFATRLPWIGDMPFRKQLEILLPTLAVSLLLAFLFMWLDSRQATNNGETNKAYHKAVLTSKLVLRMIVPCLEYR